MTKEKAFKRRVRERMSKTGESYAAARSRILEKRDRADTARTNATAPVDRPSDDKVESATGKRWNAWFAMLDRAGAREWKHGETAAFLMKEQNVPAWWSQAVTMWYQRDRGLRLKHQQADGFTIYATKTIGVDVDTLYDAFVNARTRRKWLADGSMSLRTSRAGYTARFNWEDGTTRVTVSFEKKGAAKATVAVAHERLSDPTEAERSKTAWRKRLADLKAFLES